MSTVEKVRYRFLKAMIIQMEVKSMKSHGKVWKSVVAMGLASAMAAGLLAGCGSSGSDANSTKATEGSKSPGASAGSETKGDGKQVTLRYGYWGKRQEEMLKILVAQFESENPDIKIEMELTPVSDYWTKLEEAAGGGSAPDVFWMNGPHFELYAENNILLPLEDIDVDYAGFPQALTDLYTYSGKKYGVPKDFDTTAVWYNKELFDNAGVAYPTEDWTWEDMVEKAKALTDAAAGIYGIVAPLDPQSCFYNTMYANGAYVLSDDKKSCGFAAPEAVEAIQCWVDLIDSGLSPTLAQIQDTDENTLFESGKVAMIWAGSYMTGEFMGNEMIEGKVDLVSVPSFNGSKGNVINGLANVVYAKSTHQEEAKRFVTWLGSKEAMDLQGKQGVVISAYNASQDLFAQVAPEMNLGVYAEMTKIAKPYPVDKTSSKWNDLLTQYIKQAYMGEMTTQEACNKLAAEMDAVLAGN